MLPVEMRKCEKKPKEKRKLNKQQIFMRGKSCRLNPAKLFATLYVEQHSTLHTYIYVRDRNAPVQLLSPMLISYIQILCFISVNLLIRFYVISSAGDTRTFGAIKLRLDDSYRLRRGANLNGNLVEYNLYICLWCYGEGEGGDTTTCGYYREL